MDNPKIQPASFFERLPLEIRLEIYRYLLSTKYTKYICVDQEVRSEAHIPMLTALAASLAEYNI